MTMVKSIEVPDFTLGVCSATSSLASAQYHAVKLDALGGIVICGAGESAIGYLRNAPAAGAEAEVVCSGVALAMVGAAGVTAGDEVMTDASGHITTQTGVNPKCGVALQTGVSGEVVSVLLLTRSGIGSAANRSIMTIPYDMTKIANGDLVTDMIPGFAGVIEKFYWIQEDAVTTGAKAATINLEIEATNVTGGVLSLTSAACTPLGKVVYATAITADNAFTAAQKISIEASATTAFQEGKGMFCLVLKNS